MIQDLSCSVLAKEEETTSILQNASLAYGSKRANLHLLTGRLVFANAIMFKQSPRVLVVYAFVGVVKADIARRVICPIDGATARARRQ